MVIDLRARKVKSGHTANKGCSWTAENFRGKLHWYEKLGLPNTVFFLVFVLLKDFWFISIIFSDSANKIYCIYMHKERCLDTHFVVLMLSFAFSSRLYQFDASYFSSSWIECNLLLCWESAPWMPVEWKILKYTYYWSLWLWLLFLFNFHFF